MRTRLTPPSLTDYAFGGIQVDGEHHREDLIVLPDRVVPSWWRRRGHRLQLVDMETIFEAAPEVLVVGQGYFGRMKVDSPVVVELRRRNIELRAEWTAKAVDSYQQLRERRRVVAALHLTC
jgi:hypothetical protein